jgi:ABC-type phosphate transport system substrate-binding protein
MTSRANARARRGVGLAIVVALLGLVTFGPQAVAAPAASTRPIVGSGSSFSALLVGDTLAKDVKKKPYSLDINYQASGSTDGRSQFARGTVDFAMSDIEYQSDDPEKATAGSFKYITFVAGALGIMYNVTGVDGSRITQLNLTSSAACRIFTEEEIRWNDPEIVSLNPSVAGNLPETRINAVVRADGSGTSYVFSEFCIATASSVWEAFRARIAGTPLDNQAMRDGRPTSNFPYGGRVGGAKGSEGVGGFVPANPNSVTFIEAGYVEVTGMPLARLRNAAGVFVEPTPGAITTALCFASVRANGTFALDFTVSAPRPDRPNCPNPRGAYFPSTYSYLIVPTTGIEPTKGRTLAEFAYYGLTAGQGQVEGLKYAKLSANLIEDGLTTAAAIPGASDLAVWMQQVGLVVVAGGTTTTTVAKTGGTTTTVPGNGGSGTGGSGSGVGGTNTTVTGTGGSGTGTGGGSTGGGSTGGAATGGSGTATSVASKVGATATTIASGKSTKATTATTKTGTGSQVAGVTIVPSDGGSATPSATGVDDGTLDSVVAAEASSNESDGSSDGGSGDVESAGDVPAAAPTKPKGPGPSNAEVVWTLLQGAAIVAVGVSIAKTVGHQRMA